MSDVACSSDIIQNREWSRWSSWKSNADQFQDSLAKRHASLWLVRMRGRPVCRLVVATPFRSIPARNLTWLVAVFRLPKRVRSSYLATAAKFLRIPHLLRTLTSAVVCHVATSGAKTAPLSHLGNWIGRIYMNLNIIDTTVKVLGWTIFIFKGVRPGSRPYDEIQVNHTDYLEYLKLRHWSHWTVLIKEITDTKLRHVAWWILNWTNRRHHIM